MEFFATSAGISVHVWDSRDEKYAVRPDMTQAVTPGSGQEGKPCLVLLHGYLETMYVFNELAEALKPHYRIITLDMPGHGLTDSAPADVGGNRVNTLSFSASVVAGVLDKCGVEKAWIAGHSMGGYVAQQFLHDCPGRTEGVILLCSHPWPDAPEKAAEREKEKQLIRAGKLLTIASVSIPKMYDEENLRACDEKIRETIELCETHDPEGIIASIEGLRTRGDLQEVMQEASVPLMLIYGDRDNFLPLEKVEQMKSLFPGVRYRLVPDTGHNAFIERQDEVVDAVIDFIGARSSPA